MKSDLVYIPYLFADTANLVICLAEKLASFSIRKEMICSDIFVPVFSRKVLEI